MSEVKPKQHVRTARNIVFPAAAGRVNLMPIEPPWAACGSNQIHESDFEPQECDRAREEAQSRCDELNRMERE